MIIVNELQLIINAKNKEQVEKILALFNLGVVDALENGTIDLGEALRSFYAQFKLKELKVFRPEVEKIIGAGQELLDLQEIYPEKYEQLWKEQYRMLREFSEQILKKDD